MCIWQRGRLYREKVLQIFSLEVAEALSKTIACSIDKNFLIEKNELRIWKGLVNIDDMALKGHHVIKI